MPTRLRRVPIDVLVLGVLIAVAGICVPAVALANHNFSDVPTSAGYHNFVDFLVQNGITTGCGSGLFCPGNPVTRAQMAIFLQKLATALETCPPDSVRSGTTCIDRYEASVWYVPPALNQSAAGRRLIEQIRLGTVTEAELRGDWVPEPVQVGLTSVDLASVGCSRSGSDAGCKDIYAVSIPGAQPARYITWFQAVAAARNAKKRLPTNAEWQAAALGTPKASCHTGVAIQSSGSAPGCVSHVGAFDMVGNAEEYVDGWVLGTTSCAAWGVDLPSTICASLPVLLRPHWLAAETLRMIPRPAFSL